MLVRAALEQEIALMTDRVAESPEAALALSLAACMDDPDSTTSAANVGKTLLDVLVRLRALVPDDGKDALDELHQRREQRLAGGAAT